MSGISPEAGASVFKKYESPNMLSLEELKTWIERLAARLEMGEQWLPAYGRVGDGAYVEVDDRMYHYVGIERGIENERFSTPDLDALFERVFRSVTFELAFRYEARHRTKVPKDCRRVAFRLQTELLSKLSLAWAKRETERHEEILQKHPFDDFAGARASLCGTYRAQGKTQEEAWKMACEKYPPSNRINE
jgi:hypothetical protein